MKRRLLLALGLSFSMLSFNQSFAAEGNEQNLKLLDDEEEEAEKKEKSKEKESEDKEVADNGELADIISNQRANDQFRQLQRTGTFPPEQGPIPSDQYQYQDQYQYRRGRE